MISCELLAGYYAWGFRDGAFNLGWDGSPGDVEFDHLGIADHGPTAEASFVSALWVGTCAKSATEGTGCGHSIRMDKVDELVLQAIEEQVFDPKRLVAILAAMTARIDTSARQLETEINRQHIAAQARLDRLYDAIEAGVVELQDPRFKDRVDFAKMQIREGSSTLEALRQRNTARAELSTTAIRHFSSGIRRRLRDADPAFRRT